RPPARPHARRGGRRLGAARPGRHRGDRGRAAARPAARGGRGGRFPPQPAGGRGGRGLLREGGGLSRLTTFLEANMKTSTPTKPARSAAPRPGQRPRETQALGSVVPMPIALAEGTRRASAEYLNQLLADTITLRDLYKKHHWQVSG